MTFVPQNFLVAGIDEAGVPRIVSVTPSGELSTSQTSGYVPEFDAVKNVSAGQSYLDLLCDPVLVPANTQVTIGAGSNYDLSPTGSWIKHPDIARAKAVQVFGNFSQATEVKLYTSPETDSDQNTPEYVYRGNGETEWMFQDKTGAAFAMGAPASSRILPISANALKFYVKNQHATVDETVEFFIRLIF